MLSLLQNLYVSRPLPRANPRLCLFCFPYAGGGASVYARWAKTYPETVEVCPIQLPGRENRLRDQLISKFDDKHPVKE